MAPPPRREYDPDYLTRKAALPRDLQLELDLIEERIITDPNRTYQRTLRADGVVVDVSGWDEYGLEVGYLPLEGGAVFRFVGLTVAG